MARIINRLNAGAVGTITKYGRHADGGGLYLSISPNGGRRWVFLFRRHGKPTEIGFGSARDVTLVRARELGAWARAKLAEGINPKHLKRPPEGVTFGECADRVIEAMRPSWRNGKHAAQWEMTLRHYGAPLRHLPVGKITTDDVLSVLKPLWNEKPPTAYRLRGRIERVLDAAKAQGLRSGENPARWRGHLDQLLPKRERLTRGHHAAMGYNSLPAFMADLQARQATAAPLPAFMVDLQAWQVTAALALEFAILTAARSGEVLGARWDEFDLDRLSGRSRPRVRKPVASIAYRCQDVCSRSRRLCVKAVMVSSYFLVGGLAGHCQVWRSKWCSAASRSTLLWTAFAPLSETGQQSAPISRTRSAKRHLPM
jgi:hypothetical protein